MTRSSFLLFEFLFSLIRFFCRHLYDSCLKIDRHLHLMQIPISNQCVEQKSFEFVVLNICDFSDCRSALKCLRFWLFWMNSTIIWLFFFPRLLLCEMIIECDKHNRMFLILFSLNFRQSKHLKKCSERIENVDLWRIKREIELWNYYRRKSNNWLNKMRLRSLKLLSTKT